MTSTITRPGFLDEVEEIIGSGCRDYWASRFQNLAQIVTQMPDADRPWPEARRACLERHGGRCTACRRPARTVHHIFPKRWSEGRMNSQVNLAPLCRSCHAALEWNGRNIAVALALLRRTESVLPYPVMQLNSRKEISYASVPG
jgi:hypothetical protein